MYLSFCLPRVSFCIWNTHVLQGKVAGTRVAERKFDCFFCADGLLVCRHHSAVLCRRTSGRLVPHTPWHNREGQRQCTKRSKHFCLEGPFLHRDRETCKGFIMRAATAHSANAALQCAYVMYFGSNGRNLPMNHLPLTHGIDAHNR